MFSNKRVDDILEGLREPTWVFPETMRISLAEFVVKKQIEVLEKMLGYKNTVKETLGRDTIVYVYCSTIRDEIEELKRGVK